MSVPAYSSTVRTSRFESFPAAAIKDSNRNSKTNPETLRVCKVDFFTNVLLSLPVLLHRVAACVHQSLSFLLYGVVACPAKNENTVSNRLRTTKIEVNDTAMNSMNRFAFFLCPMTIQASVFAPYNSSNRDRYQGDEKAGGVGPSPASPWRRARPSPPSFHDTGKVKGPGCPP